jgi:F-type H+-transporting ATPase subunit b
MQEIVHQIGELFLQAVPTAVIVLVFYFVLRGLFFRPLLKVMAEREARTSGAQRDAEAAQTAAAEKIKQYQDALRNARVQVYSEQEASRKKLLEVRAAQLKAAHTQAAAEVGAAKQRVAAETSAARKDVEATIGQLSAEIARRILQAPPGPPRATR